MIYNHRVKRNGVYYSAGEDVPENIEVSGNEMNNEPENIDSSLEGNNSDSQISRRGRPKKMN